jgi:glycerophosphodiester phosphodiesterase
MSFIVAGMLGADFIEFDVLLTADRTPVVYHDMEIESSIQEEGDQSEGDPLVVGVHQLSLRQIERCRFAFKPKHPCRFKQLVHRHMDAILTYTENGRRLLRERLLRKKTPRLLRLLESIPTLKSLFYCIPSWVGFNIEIKYPIECKHSHLRGLREYELNAYIDRILECVFVHAGDRRIFFSCFDPDVCMLLHQKQPRYPVFFLTCAGTCTDFVDQRCLSIEQACSFAKAEGLQGIVTESTCILEDPMLASRIQRDGLIVITWGDKNTELDNVVRQKKMGVDGIISDNISDLTRMQGKSHNVFRDDLDLVGATLPRLLPVDKRMAEDFNAFRAKYRSFRSGKSRGAKGELSRFVEVGGEEGAGAAERRVAGRHVSQ